MYVGARTLGQVAGKRGTPVIILSALRAQVSGATGGPTATGVFVSPQTLKYSPSAAKAFVAFSCTGTTPIVKSSFNVSTVTRGAAGVFKITYTSALNTGYAVVVSLKASNAGVAVRNWGNILASAGALSSGFVKVNFFSTGSSIDPYYASVVVYGGLP